MGKYLIIAAAVLSLLGCLPKHSSQDLAEKRAELAHKAARFKALQSDLNSGRLAAGAQQDRVQEDYGKPDDVIRSCTGVSCMEIWSYERILAGHDDQWMPVRLYFNDKKLVSWIF